MKMPNPIAIRFAKLIFSILSITVLGVIFAMISHDHNTKQRKWSTWGAPLLLLFRRSLVRIIGQGSCYDAYSTKGTYLIGGENIWIYSILTTMAK